MVNWGTVTPIVVAIIGIVLPVLSAVFINQIYSKPTINIDLGMKLENGKQIINITNSGTIPATNLSLIITANNHIINNITSLLSTTSIFLVSPGPPSLLETNNLTKINDTSLELGVKKFTNGAGSIIKLAIGSKDTVFKDYVVYAAYDQGSSKSGKQGTDISSNPAFIFFLAVEASAGFYMFTRWAKRDTRRRILQKIIKEIMQVRKLLRREPLIRDITLVERSKFERLSSYWELPDRTWKKYFEYDSEDKNETYMRKIFREVNDYRRIDDFYSKLADRYLEMKPNPAIDDFRLAELNRQCLKLAENALEKVDWNKYR